MKSLILGWCGIVLLSGCATHPVTLTQQDLAPVQIRAVNLTPSASTNRFNLNIYTATNTASYPVVGYMVGNGQTNIYTYMPKSADYIWLNTNALPTNGDCQIVRMEKLTGETSVGFYTSINDPWNGLEGHPPYYTYTLQRTFDFVTWQDVTSVPIDAENPATQTLCDMQVFPNAYYRIVRN